ncbi:MAG: hypothetical protein ABFS02_09760 [Pseudomonadota bacterium]
MFFDQVSDCFFVFVGLSAGDVVIVPRGRGYWFSGLPERPENAPHVNLNADLHGSLPNRREVTAVLMGGAVCFSGGSDHPLVRHENVICTPHLGASTEQAQVNVSIAVAEQVRDYVLSGLIGNAVNVPRFRAGLKNHGIGAQLLIQVSL